MTNSGARLKLMKMATMLMASGEIVDCVDLVSTLNQIEINQQNKHERCRIGLLQDRVSNQNWDVNSGYSSQPYNHNPVDPENHLFPVSFLFLHLLLEST